MALVIRKDKIIRLKHKYFHIASKNKSDGDYMKMSFDIEKNSILFMAVVGVEYQEFNLPLNILEKYIKENNKKWMRKK